MSYAGGRGTRAGARGAARNLLMLPMAIFFGVALLAAAYVAYVLWPRWPGPPIAADAPSLPVVIGGVTFNVTPGAIRRSVQRRPGVQERIDLAFLWPSLLPPDLAAEASPGSPAAAAAVAATALDRVFITIATSESALPPVERMRTIYPRYLTKEPVAGPGGLVQLAFRNDTPYRGEDLLYPNQDPDSFLLRCTRQGAGPAPGTCLYERRIGEADLTARFPRDWLNDWRAVAKGIDRLVDAMRPQVGATPRR
jgi:hypothetical protein